MANPSPVAVGPASVEQERHVRRGAHHELFNNTIISITDQRGDLIARRPPATSASRAPASRLLKAQMAAESRPRHGARRSQGRRSGQGPGFGRETAIRSIQQAGIEGPASRTARRFRTTAAVSTSVGGPTMSRYTDLALARRLGPTSGAPRAKPSPSTSARTRPASTAAPGVEATSAST